MKLKKIAIGFLVLIAIVSVTLTVNHYRNLPPESRVYINGHVLTMDSENRIVEAIAVERDKIIAAGGNVEIKKLIKDNSIVVDLKGKTILPGFIDAHSHFPGAGLYAHGANLNSPPIGQVKDVAEAIESLKKVASKIDKGEWVLGFGYDDTILKEKRHLTRADLDRVSSDHPVAAMHISGHFIVANSAALKKAGIDASTKNPQGGIVHKDPETREPTGLLEESAKDPVYEMALELPLLDKLKIMKLAAKEYAKSGVTTAQNGLANDMMIEGLSMASRFGMISLRLMVWPDLKMGEKIINKELSPKKYNSDMFHLGALKLVNDGSIQGYTGYLSKPYYVPYNGDKNYRGYPIYKKEKLTEIVSKFHRRGFQIAIHGNGDAAIDDIIHAIGVAQKKFPRKDSRHIIIHSQMARNDQLDKMKKLGITPSFFSAHAYYWGDRHWNIFMGPERARLMSPTGSALKRELPFTIHLDSPVVPMSPLLAVWSTVNRISSGGRIIGAGERIPVMQALRAVTIDAAWQVFMEKNRGSIEKGKFADLVILSADPLKNPMGIKGIQVEETIVGGKSVYSLKN